MVDRIQLNIYYVLIDKLYLLRLFEILITMRVKHLLIIASLCCFYNAIGQEKQVFFLFDYLIAPTGQHDDLNFNKTKLKFNIPLKIRKGKLTNKITLNYYEFDYNTNIFNNHVLDKYYNIGYQLNYQYPINNKWNFSTSLGASIISNLTASLSSNDIQYTGNATIKRVWKSKSLKIGAQYDVITGEPIVLPFISFENKVNNKFSYGIGFPKTYASYTLNKRSKIKLLAKQNGFYGNISNLIILNNEQRATHLSFTSSSIAFIYNYAMSNNWSFFIKTGYAVANKNYLKNKHNSIYEFDINNQFYFSSGVKFNL